MKPMDPIPAAGTIPRCVRSFPGRELKAGHQETLPRARMGPRTRNAAEPERSAAARTAAKRFADAADLKDQHVHVALAP